MPDQVDAAPVPQIVSDRYHVREIIGRGGSAVVYAAHDTLLGREVAVKIFRSTAETAEELRLQETEARLIARLNHHALTTLFDAGIDTSDPAQPQIYLVMERIPGLDLRQHLRQHGPLRPAQLAYLGFDLAEALQHVHEHGYLHRDIKPANLLIAAEHANSRLRGKLTDFGIASIIGATEHGEATTGTAAYLSPEQVDGADPTTASDVYPLGLVLLEALTGHVAYPGSVEESAFARLDRDPVIPDHIPAALADVLRGMTARQPADRLDLAACALRFQRAIVQDLIDTQRVSPEVLAPHEEQRLVAVSRYNILDTPADDAFDRITHLACRLLDVPIALVSIVDADREWFKAARGIEVDPIDRDVALCSITVATNRALVVPDVQARDEFAHNPIVRDNPHLHGFAAVPLQTQDGHAIGTLCVFTSQTRDFTPAEVDDLAKLADIAMRELEFRSASRRALFT